MKKIIISSILSVSFVTSVYAQQMPPLMKSDREIMQQNQMGPTQTNNQTIQRVTYPALSPSAKTASKNLLNLAIKKYKYGNYIGAMQTLQSVTEKDPGNVLAHYYLGMTYTKIGYADKAGVEYDTVIALCPNSELAKNATIGKGNLSGNPQPPVVEKTVTPGMKPVQSFMSDEAKEKLQEKNIKTIIENINNNRENNPAIYKRIENLEPKKSSSDDKPTQEQIAEAMAVLTKAGINPANSYTSTNPYAASMQAAQMNPEMMQMNMLMSSMGGGSNNNGGNSMNNMLPMLMMMQNGQVNNKVDAETMQTLMSQMMMSGMTDLYSNNNNNNN